MVYLTTKEKPLLPTHVKLRSSGRESTAICEQIHTVSAQKLGKYYGCCSPEEMAEIDAALALSIGIAGVKHELPEELSADDETLMKLYQELLAAEARADAYEAAFFRMLDKATQTDAEQNDQ